ncbi:olfactory receptor 2AT4-like [Spea bombifrons]|uniref:olfactory receptor 2AT4-like n=1 Tax=Spea bombifrons TaxID=233779 RepID=UPI002349B003|nr:olfactory receptor 2AT4-like [Spea bombifrons]
MANRSKAFNVELIGFPGLQEKYFNLVSATLFLVYIISLAANGTVIGLVMMKKQLYQPMYVIIANLAASDLLFDTLTLPKIVARYWFGSGSMSFSECLFQMFSVHHLGTVDSFIIMLMAVDRYVAICKPLRYPSIMTNRVTGLSCSLCWIMTMSTPSVTLYLNSQISYCGRYKIIGCFCTNMGVNALSCTDISYTRQVVFGLAMVVLLGPLSFIISSYIIILTTIQSSSQFVSGKKAFYTCFTHLIVIGLYYTPRVFFYSFNQIYPVFTTDQSILILCVYTYVPHMASPIIYCLRTKEIKQICRNLFVRH